MPSADNSKCPLSILVWTGLLKRTDGLAGFLLFRYLGKKWKRCSRRSFTYLKNWRRLARAPPWPSRQRGASRPSNLCLSLHHLRHHQLQHQLLQQPIQLLHVIAITMVHDGGSELQTLKEPPWQRQHPSPLPLLSFCCPSLIWQMPLTNIWYYGGDSNKESTCRILNQKVLY